MLTAPSVIHLSRLDVLYSPLMFHRPTSSLPSLFSLTPRPSSFLQPRPWSSSFPPHGSLFSSFLLLAIFPPTLNHYCRFLYSLSFLQLLCIRLSFLLFCIVPPALLPRPPFTIQPNLLHSLSCSACLVSPALPRSFSSFSPLLSPS